MCFITTFRLSIGALLYTLSARLNYHYEILAAHTLCLLMP